MVCLRCQEPRHLSPLTRTPPWVLQHLEHHMVYLCICHPEVPFHPECPLPSDPWDQMDDTTPRGHLRVCRPRVCPLCPAWQVRRPTDFRLRWDYLQTGCRRHLTQVCFHLWKNAISYQLILKLERGNEFELFETFVNACLRKPFTKFTVGSFFSRGTFARKLKRILRRRHVK